MAWPARPISYIKMLRRRFNKSHLDGVYVDTAYHNVQKIAVIMDDMCQTLTAEFTDSSSERGNLRVCFHIISTLHLIAMHAYRHICMT